MVSGDLADSEVGVAGCKKGPAGMTQSFGIRPLRVSDVVFVFLHDPLSEVDLIAVGGLEVETRGKRCLGLDTAATDGEASWLEFLLERQSVQEPSALTHWPQSGYLPVAKVSRVALAKAANRDQTLTIDSAEKPPMPSAGLKAGAG